MPNHLHSLIGFKSSKELSINKIIGNGKRFMAYDMVDRLKVLDQPGILEVLSSNVNTSDHRKGKIHQVFEPSFDWKECWTEKFMVQKLDYMHANPCRGNWSLADEYWEYPHSSGHFYATGNQGVYPVTHVGELRNIDLTLE
jgi:REP element-mobilizing transposase RayT